MGCHTWFNAKKEVDYDLMKSFVLNEFRSTNDLLQSYINDTNSEEYLDMVSIYTYLTVEYMSWVISVNERKIRIIENGYCQNAVVHKYCIFNNYTYVEGKGIYIDAGYHNAFRNGNGHIDKQLFSYDETIDFLKDESNNCLILENTFVQVREFWDKHPEGMIEFI